MTLRPQDIYVLLALVAGDTNCENAHWTFEQLALDLGMSPSQVFRSTERADAAHLFDKSARRVRKLELMEFLAHGVRYAFAASPGGFTRGVPTCWSAPGMADIVSSHRDDVYVWPSPHGTARGQAIAPLHPSVPVNVSANHSLYQLLALTDVFRVGSARERRVASQALQRLLQ